jgi:hypothetical protein
MTCEFRSTDEPRPGVVFGSTFGLAEVRYSAIDGKAIFEGDIIIGTVGEMEALAGTREAVVITPEQFRWPDGLIPFEIEAVPLSKASPALAAFGEELHMVHLGDSSNEIWHSRSTDRRTWAEEVRVNGQLSKAAPALAPFGGELHMVHLGDSSNDIWHSWSSDGRTWSENVTIPGQQSEASPALAAFGRELHMVHLGDSSNDIWHSWSSDGRTWSENVTIPGQQSKASPALAAFGRELHMVHLGDSSNNIWHSWSSDGQTWSENVTIPGQQSKASPALAALGTELHVVHLGDSSNDIWHSWSADGRNWSENVRIKDQQSKAAPALAVLEELHMVHLGDSTNRVWRSWTADGRKWAGNTHPAPRSRILDAMKHWEEHTKIRFVERNPDNAERFPDYVYVHEADGCASAVGRHGGRQDIELAVTCSLGNAIHEIGHTVGLWHEQSREDRDSFVRILFENIEAGREHNFDQHITDGDDVGEYDYGSIMHYPRDAFSTNGPTIIPLVEGASIGQRDGLSERDIAAVNFLYP